MPSKGFACITVSKELYDRLSKIAKERILHGVPKLIEKLIDSNPEIVTSNFTSNLIKPRAGIEPATCALQGRRSTTEPPGLTN